MADEPRGAPINDALHPLAPGPLIRIAHGATTVAIAPQSGGRLAQVEHGGVEWLIGYGRDSSAAIAWGCYPMLPWAGRLRDSRFAFEGQRYQVPSNLGAHAIHGFGFALPWQVGAHAADRVELSLQLPRNDAWPFGGLAHQRIEVGDGRLRLALSLTAEERALPAVIGWHPWFRIPDRIEFSPQAMYPRDREGIATLPPGRPSSGPWDDCFLVDEPVLVHHAGQRLRLSSDCHHWVLYDSIEHATCIEPQSGPPDGLNLEPRRIEAGASLQAWFLWEWL